MGTDRWPDTYKKRRFWRETRTVSVESALGGLLEALDHKGTLKFVRLWENWAEVVGAEVAGLARPLARRGRTLVLLSEDPMTSQHLSFLVPEILGRINSFLGESLFDDVRFELSDGRPPLNRPSQQTTTPAPRRQKRPKNLGQAADKFDPDSPLGRAYRAYLAMHEDDQETND
ncbi:MAG: DUF721 domain-containing protein [Proteobacteria bacterium]|nr:DUF721 domain-containing protein [Pseudomonadota bacterium]MBU1612764.1 DUF721 domain-containing protein [Pseudomonadota bacterium]